MTQQNAVGDGGNPLLGLATTRELLGEIEARALIGRLDLGMQEHWPALRDLELMVSRSLASLPRPVLEYRTVDQA